MNIFLLVIIFLLLSHTVKAFQTRDIQIKVRIFQVPPLQSIVKSKPLPEGGIEGTMTGGYVTASFPDGIVMFETDLFQSNEDIIRVIKEKVKFCCPEVVNILAVEDIDFHVDTVTLETSVIKEKEELSPVPLRYRHLQRDYSLAVQPLSIEKEEAILKVQFSVQIEEVSEEKKILLNHTFGVKFPRMLIVGFPSNEDGGRGTVYWLAVTVDGKLSNIIVKE